MATGRCAARGSICSPPPGAAFACGGRFALLACAERSPEPDGDDIGNLGGHGAAVDGSSQGCDAAAVEKLPHQYVANVPPVVELADAAQKVVAAASKQ